VEKVLENKLVKYGEIMFHRKFASFHFGEVALSASLGIYVSFSQGSGGMWIPNQGLEQSVWPKAKKKFVIFPILMQSGA
jgi:hypothetical protein